VKKYKKKHCPKGDGLKIFEFIGFEIYLYIPPWYFLII